MKTITKDLYEHFLNKENVPEDLKKELTNKAHETQWVFIGSDFSG